ncbi:unnamed protein product, partial [Urochloa humidicola]
RLRGSQGLHSTQRAVEKCRNSKKASGKGVRAQPRENPIPILTSHLPLPPARFVPFHPFQLLACFFRPPRFPSAPGSGGIGAAGCTEEAGQGIGGSPPPPPPRRMSDRELHPLRSIRITGDGRCLFRSVAYGACLRRGKQSPSDSAQKELADELRAKVSVNHHPELMFIQHIVVRCISTEFCNVWLLTCCRLFQVADEFVKRREDTEWFLEGDFESYVRKMRKPHAWGGEPELLMCSHVLSSDSPRIIAEYGQEYGKDDPVRVLYDGYGHYDALQPSLERCVDNRRLRYLSFLYRTAA